MERVENPGSDPKQNVLLTLEGIDIGKENANQQSGEEKTERDNTLYHQG